MRRGGSLSPAGESTGTWARTIERTGEDAVAAQPSDEHVHTLVSAARMYYEQDLSQEEIAARLGKSRPTISRLLNAARREGIVHIDIRVPLDRSYALERALQDR